MLKPSFIAQILAIWCLFLTDDPCWGTYHDSYLHASPVEIETNRIWILFQIQATPTQGPVDLLKTLIGGVFLSRLGCRENGFFNGGTLNHAFNNRNFHYIANYIGDLFVETPISMHNSLDLSWKRRTHWRSHPTTVDHRDLSFQLPTAIHLAMRHP